MSSISEIRHRIKAVEDTRKITRAMFLIASAKMQKAMKMHERNLPYLRRISQDMRYIIENTGARAHSPYFAHRPLNRAVYLVIAGDKGMCGAYNEEVLRLADATIQADGRERVSVFTIGLMAYSHFARLGMAPDIHYLHVAQNPNLQSSREITLELCDMYNRNLFDDAYIIFTNMLASRTLRPEVIRLLPILEEDFADVEPLHGRALEMEYVPSEEAALAALVPQHLIGLVYSACAQAYASEQSARMMAMDASTRNADEMLLKLNTEHNRARQAAITQELTEIIAGANSVL
ncbi:MAG: ATP synthase F1 subunit gamma [Firmicutes bacterium]|nr:ATP synthase F1 subunit gamma [Bacillota bacterium]